MNNVSLMGRLTRDVTSRKVNTQNGEQTVAAFTIAVNRRKKDEADFISCQAWGRTAEIIEQHFRKGDRIAVTGRIQTGSYQNKDGQKVYTTDVVVDNFDFVETRKDAAVENPPDDFIEVTEGLPF